MESTDIKFLVNSDIIDPSYLPEEHDCITHQLIEQILACLALEMSCLNQILTIIRYYYILVQVIKQKAAHKIGYADFFG